MYDALTKGRPNFAYQNRVTCQTTASHVQSVTGILLIFAQQKIFKQHFFALISSMKQGPGKQTISESFLSRLYFHQGVGERWWVLVCSPTFRFIFRAESGLKFMDQYQDLASCALSTLWLRIFSDGSLLACFETVCFFASCGLPTEWLSILSDITHKQNINK